MFPVATPCVEGQCNLLYWFLYRGSTDCVGKADRLIRVEDDDFGGLEPDNLAMLVVRVNYIRRAKTQGFTARLPTEIGETAGGSERAVKNSGCELMCLVDIDFCETIW